MLIPVAAAIDPNDWPGRTVQNIGPGGFGLGLWGFGGCCHRFRRWPGVRASEFTVGLKACSWSTDRPVLPAISANVSPGRTVQ
jgi:hypothetical protein